MNPSGVSPLSEEASRQPAALPTGGPRGFGDFVPGRPAGSAKYNDLHLFELPGPTRVIEWIGDQRICVAAYENGSRNEILQLLLPPRLFAKQNKPPDSGLQIWCMEPDETDMIKLLSVIFPTKTEDTSWSKIPTSCAKPACVLHGQRISNLQMTEIESEKSLWVAARQFV